MDFSAPEVAEIEAGLAGARPDGWRRLRAPEVGALSALHLISAWRIDLPGGLHLHPFVDHLIVGITAAFPLADPLVIAPQANASGAPAWPHIEFRGNFCLPHLPFSTPASERVLGALEDALTVLRMTEDVREDEHRREFLSYWTRWGQASKLPYLSLLSGPGRSRDIVYVSGERGQKIFAEDAERLEEWQRRVGAKPTQAQSTRLIWLSAPLLPDDYPKTGADVFALDPAHSFNAQVQAGQVLPVLLGCELDGQAVCVCVEIEGLSLADSKKGFRGKSPMPAHLVAASFKGRKAVRRSVSRADYAWVHGRGRNPDIEKLRGKKVAIVGCGALGGFLARALAQAGVGSLLLFDKDTLAPSNVGRHLLGIEFVGHSKAGALARRLEREFPHAVRFDAWEGLIEMAKPEHAQALAGCDLVIAAGIDLEGELALDRWRASLPSPPPLIWTWIEEFASAGHAAALTGSTRLIDALDEEGAFRMRLTSNWPAGAHAVEAGCGTAYQPYDAAEMMGTIGVAHRLALDVLLGKALGPVVRSWLGNWDRATSRGAALSSAFDGAYREIERDWPGSP